MNDVGMIQGLPNWAILIFLLLALFTLCLKYWSTLREWWPHIKAFFIVCRNWISWPFSLRGQKQENQQIKWDGVNDQLREIGRKLPRDEPVTGYLDGDDAVQIFVDRRVIQFKRVKFNGGTTYKIRRYNPYIVFLVFEDYVRRLNHVLGTSDIFHSNKHLEDAVRLLTLCALVKTSGRGQFLKRQLSRKKDEILCESTTYQCHKNLRSANRWMQTKKITVKDLPVRERRILLHTVGMLSSSNGGI